ncbi:MAG TPA: hypothetical protein VGR31_08640 [Planctomycetota bacterium]|jgi:hypothetical protein|nr:hypothetical protein [Planctomycetota bacterium]
MQFLLALLLALCAPFAGDCMKCHGTGKLPCPKHPAAEAVLEESVLYCSVIEGCAVCGGTGFIGCDGCHSTEARAALDAKRANIPKVKAELATIDETMGRALRKTESAHFVFTWDMDKQKIDNRLVSAHEAMHVYTSRMERLFGDICTTFGITEKEFQDRCWIFVWALPQDYEQGALKFCQSTAKTSAKLMGIHPRYSICAQKKDFRTDEQLHRNLVHHVTHLLLGHEHPIAWIGSLKGGWADEGLAHWFEDRYFGICDNFCMQEDNPNASFENGKFRLGVRKLVAKDDAPPIAETTQHNVDTLTLPMNATSFSYVDYLIGLGGEKFDKLVRQLKAKVPTSDALKAAYGFGLLEMETRWKAWVLQTYPTR